MRLKNRKLATRQTCLVGHVASTQVATPRHSDRCIASGVGIGVVIRLRKNLYEYTVFHVDSRSGDWLFFGRGFMDMLARKTVSNPMPEIAAFVADMKAAFGEEEIDEAIRRGRAGEPTFYACENGRAVGTAGPAETNVWRVDGTVRDRHYCDGCDGSCVGGDVSCRDKFNRIAKEKR